MSFLLRVAHDKSLRKSGVDVPYEAPETLLMKQVEQLANQIIKTKEDTFSVARGEGGAASAMPTRFVRAMPAESRSAFAHPGVNF